MEGVRSSVRQAKPAHTSPVPGFSLAHPAGALQGRLPNSTGFMPVRSGTAFDDQLFVKSCAKTFHL
jgi:hypothetical protein